MGARSVSSFGNGLVALALAALGLALLVGAWRALARPLSIGPVAVGVAPIALLTPPASAPSTGKAAVGAFAPAAPLGARNRAAARRPEVPSSRRRVAVARPRRAKRPEPLASRPKAVAPRAPAASRPVTAVPYVAPPVLVRSMPVAVSVARPKPSRRHPEQPRFGATPSTQAALLRRRLGRWPTLDLSTVDEGARVSLDDPSDLPVLQRATRRRR